jgi:uncharacterized protein with PIN domain
MSRSRGSRIQRAYTVKFQGLLGLLGARRPDQGVAWLETKVQTLCLREGFPMAAALALISDELRAKVRRFRRRLREGSTESAKTGSNAPLTFFCDAGLGGLARWLRAAGYDAAWEPDIHDDELIRKVARTGPVLLTTDSLLMERRVLRDGIVRAVWLPPTMKVQQHLALVLDELNLPILDPRCMHCGGELRSIEKETVKTRIPPRTYRWLDEYWICQRCEQLFWRGTHWQRIQFCLERASAQRIS